MVFRLGIQNKIVIIGRESVVRDYEPGKKHIFFHVRIMNACCILLIYVFYSLFVM